MQKNLLSFNQLKNLQYSFRTILYTVFGKENEIPRLGKENETPQHNKIKE